MDDKITSLIRRYILNVVLRKSFYDNIKILGTRFHKRVLIITTLFQE